MEFSTRILEWVDTTFSRGSSQPRDWTQISYISGRFFTVWATWEALWANLREVFPLFSFLSTIFKTWASLRQNLVVMSDQPYKENHQRCFSLSPTQLWLCLGLLWLPVTPAASPGWLRPSIRRPDECKVLGGRGWPVASSLGKTKFEMVRATWRNGT